MLPITSHSVDWNPGLVICQLFLQVFPPFVHVHAYRAVSSTPSIVFQSSNPEVPVTESKLAQSVLQKYCDEIQDNVKNDIKLYFLRTEVMFHAYGSYFPNRHKLLRKTWSWRLVLVLPRYSSVVAKSSLTSEIWTSRRAYYYLSIIIIIGLTLQIFSIIWLK